MGLQELLRTASNFQEARVLLTAHELGVFDAVGSGKGARRLAGYLGTSPRGTEILLDALVAMGLLRKRGSRYYNTETANAYLVSTSPHYVGPILKLNGYIWERWSRLGEAVREGHLPKAGREFISDPVKNRNFILAMDLLGHETAGKVARRLDLRGVRRVLDVGGGPGHYSMALVERSPRIEAVIVDLPLTLRVARELIERRGMRGKVKTREGDFFDPRCDLGEGYDLALASNILHIEDSAHNLDLLRRIYRALNPGGTVVVNEILVDAARARPKEAALFAINMLAATARGNVYTKAEISSWLRTAGFMKIRTVRLDERGTLLIGRRP